MNKYLEKVAELMSDENKTVAKTFAMQTAAGLPAHILGGALGAALGAKHLQGAANKVGNAIGRGAVLLRKAGTPGRYVGKKLMQARGLSGKELGIGLGVSAVGGVADLAALKHGVHGKVNKK